MPTNPDNLYYQAGQKAFQDGVYLRDKPRQYLTSEWDQGWHDAMADVVRQSPLKRPTKE